MQIREYYHLDSEDTEEKLKRRNHWWRRSTPISAQPEIPHRERTDVNVFL